MKLPWWVLPVAVAVMLVLLALGGWKASSYLQREVAAATEAQRLRDKDVIVKLEQSRYAERATAAKLMADNADLRAAVAKAQAASPGARPVSTTQASTGPVTASGPGRPPPAAPAPGVPEPSQPPAAPVCLLAVGDRGELRADEVELETKLGNRVVTGALSAWRLDPGGPVNILHGPLSAALTRATVEAPAATRGVSAGLGAVAALGRSGWLVGPAVSPPPLDVLGLRVELVGGVAFGPAGDWAVQAALLGRR
jgi:hypothetical protein